MYNKPNPVYRLLRFCNSVAEQLFRNRRAMLLAFLLVVFSLFMFTRHRIVFFTAVLIMAGILSLIPSRYFRYYHHLGIELCTMAAVLTSKAYGPAAGAFTGGISIFLGFVLSGKFKPSYFISVLVMPLIGVLAHFIRDMPLFYTGLLMTVVYDLIILPFYVAMGSKAHSIAVFFATHILFNFWIFSTIAPLIYKLMT